MKANLFLMAACVFVCLGLCWSCTVCGQDVVVQQVVKLEVNEAEKPFHRELIRAAVRASKKADSGVSRRDVIRLRVAMLSPAFRESSQELAIVQLYFNGSELPTNPDGSIAVDEIKWDAEQWIAFLEKLVPIVLALLKIFGK